VALASGAEAKSALNVLTRWAEDLIADGVALPSFDKTYKHYREIQAKVDEQTQKAQTKRSRMVDMAGNSASKIAEAAGGAAMGAAIGSIIPGIGTAIGSVIGGVLGGLGAQALEDWLRGFLKQPDIDLLLDAAQKLTDDFLVDVSHAASKRRIVILLDTFEQMTALDRWVGYVGQRLHTNILFVIAGRALPNWGDVWQDWMANAQVEELKLMNEDIMRDLVKRYFATMHGGEPNPTQVNEIIRFARGLPMVVTGAVQLWVKYGVEDFRNIKVEIVANLVDRLVEGVPPELIPALEAAASVRWFDQPILRAVTGLSDVRDVYNELRHFPFVGVRVEGLALHDVVREIIDENLRTQDVERHCEMHQRAAAYFKNRMEKAEVTHQGPSEEITERLGLEFLYHCIRADEKSGIKLFQQMVEEFVEYNLVNQLRALLNDVNTYPLESENGKLWRDYYNAGLAHLEGRWNDAEAVYKRLGENERAEPKLRAYALCDLGQIWGKNAHLSKPGGIQSAIENLQQSQALFPQVDSKTVSIFSNFEYIYSFQCQWSKSIKYVEMRYQYYQENDNKYGMVYALSQLKNIYTLIGDWKKAREIIDQGVQHLRGSGENAYLKMKLYADRPWSFIGTGRFAEAEQHIREGINYIKQIGDENSLPFLYRNMGLALGHQEKYDEALEYFDQSIRKYHQRGDYGDAGKGIVSGYWGTTLIWKGELDQGRELLIQSLSQKQKSNDNLGIPQIVNWLGEAHEEKAKQVVGESKTLELANANSYYSQALSYRWTGRYYYECAALTGLLRVKYAQGDIETLSSLFMEAEQLSQRYEYNDHLASLYLTQGQIIPLFKKMDDLTELDYFKHAMVYALRYNRFLLDKVLNGRSHGTPLHPIIPYCLERGNDGRQMLISLRDWWQTGANHNGVSEPDTISPIPLGISLLQAEHIAREREPGNGGLQKGVVEQIDAVL